MARRRRDSGSPEERARREVERQRVKHLQAIHRAERELARVHARVERRVQRVMHGLIGTRPTRNDVTEPIARIFAETMQGRRVIVESLVEESARIGLDTGTQSNEAAFPESGERPIDIDATELARRQLRRSPVDGLSLSERFHSNERRVVEAMGTDLHASIHAGASVREMAERLYEIDDPVVELPAYVLDAHELIRGLTPPSEVKRTFARAIADVERRQSNLRAAGRELMRRVATGNIADVNRQTTYWVRDRALYQEQVVARFESAAAHSEAFVASTGDSPWVKGYRWNLSPSHPRPDICDVMAGQAPDGLGPGGYRIGNLPQCPAHPNCLCFFTAIIDDQHFEREIAAATGTTPPPEEWREPVQSGADWLRSIPPDKRTAILGPGRARIFQRQPERVVDSRGNLAPLWQAMGLIRPQRSEPTNIRASQVDPFGDAGRRAPQSSSRPTNKRTA